MAYIDKYTKYLNQLNEDIRKSTVSGKRVVFGYTSDLDVVIKWDVNKFNHIIEKYLDSEPSVKEGEAINTMGDLARIVSFYAIKGLGGEIDISNADICTFLEGHFETQPALGGTCAQGAAAFGAMGFPLIAHLTDQCKEVCEFLNYPGLSLVSKNGLLPVMEGATDELPVKHMILQYSKGDIIKIGDKEFEIPVSNRLIMDYDKIHKYLPIDKEFLDYLEDNANNLYSYSISGFNAIIDQNILSDKLEELKSHFAKVKAKNKNFVLYLEGAHYLNSESRNMVFSKLSEYVDILGMNEEELVDITGKNGIKTNKDDLNSVLSGLESIINIYPVNGIVLHTKDYSIYYGKEMNGIDLEKGLTLGNLMSGTRARIGYYGSQKECRDSLNMDLSPAGLAFARELESLKAKRYTCIVPSRYMEHPKYTIGLGDTFVAGMQACFIQ